MTMWIEVLVRMLIRVLLLGVRGLQLLTIREWIAWLTRLLLLGVLGMQLLTIREWQRSADLWQVHAQTAAAQRDRALTLLEQVLDEQHRVLALGNQAVDERDRALERLRGCRP